MTTRSPYRFAFIFLLAALAFGAAAFADEDSDRVRRAMQAGEIRPLSEVMAVLEKSYPGQLLEVEIEEKRGRIYYEIKKLSDNDRVLKILVDARTLEIFRVMGKDEDRARRHDSKPDKEKR